MRTQYENKHAPRLLYNFTGLLPKNYGAKCVLCKKTNSPQDYCNFWEGAL